MAQDTFLNIILNWQRK